MEKEVLDYIYNDVAVTSAVSEIARLSKANERLTKVNRNIACVAIVAMFWLVVADKRVKEQNKTIRQLTHSIEELKKAKGE